MNNLFILFIYNEIYVIISVSFQNKQHIKNINYNNSLKKGGFEMITQEYLDKIQRLRLLDDDFMYMIFRHDKRCVELLLSVLFQIPVAIDYFHIEHYIKNIAGRSIRLDIYIEGKSHIIDIEIQRDIYKAPFKRARYHQSLIDASVSFPKEKWHELPKITVVFITEKDCFQDGKAIHRIYSKDEETNEIINDGTEYIYVNGEYEGEDNIGYLMHDFRERDYQKIHYEVLKENMRYFKETTGGRKKMCEVFDEIKEEGKEEGKKEGTFEKALKNVHKLVYKKYQKKAKWLSKCTLAQLDKAFDLALNEVSYKQLKIEVLGKSH